MTDISLQAVSRHFGKTVALDATSLQIAGGELFFLLGPSGCGKSTLLRLIAGLLEPTAGRIFFSGRDVTDLPTDQRNAVMCFQSYALWPHMTVRQNVSFGLEVRKVAPGERKRRVDEVLDLVRMRELADRKPNELSGGQQQRVALARAVAVSPACLLLDEPLSNLDAQLRLEMRSEIRRICKSAGCTTVYVTHDQKEALSIADRIAVLKDGRLMQVGTPAELYHRPVSSFVAGFVGQTNLIPGTVRHRSAGKLIIETKLGMIQADGIARGDEVILSIRPEHLRLTEGPAAGNHFAAKLVETTFLGESSEHVLSAGESAGAIELKAVSSPPVLLPPGMVQLSCDPASVVVLDAYKRLCSRFPHRPHGKVIVRLQY